MFGGWDENVPGFLDGAAQDFAKRKEGENNPKPQKVGTKDQSKEQASAGQPSRDGTLAQLSEHPVQSSGEHHLPSQSLSQAFGNLSHSPELDRSAPPVISLSFNLPLPHPTSLIHLTNICKLISPCRREVPSCKFLLIPNLREGRSFPADCNLGDGHL